MRPELIKAWRDQMGWRQEDLAAALSDGERQIHPMTVSKWERGEQRPQPYLRLALKALGAKALREVERDA